MRVSPRQMQRVEGELDRLWALCPRQVTRFTHPRAVQGRAVASENTLPSLCVGGRPCAPAS